MKNFEKAMDRLGSEFTFLPTEVPTDKYVKTQGRYIWRPSNKWTH